MPILKTKPTGFSTLPLGYERTQRPVEGLPPSESLKVAHEKIDKLAYEAHRAQEHLVHQLNRQALGPLLGASAITGAPDSTRPKSGSQLTDGITFAPGQAINVAHNLGRKAAGFVVTDCQGSAHALFNDAANLSADLATTYIRLKHTGAATCVVKLLIL